MTNIYSREWFPVMLMMVICDVSDGKGNKVHVLRQNSRASFRVLATEPFALNIAIKYVGE